MNASNYAVLVALFAGSVRALLLWRAGARADVVNVVVLDTLGQGRRDVAALLRGAGSGLYLDVAEAIAGTFVEQRETPQRELRRTLERERERAIIGASRRLGRHAWLDAVCIAAIAAAGLMTLVSAQPTLASALGLLAATLLWFANVRGARSLLTRLHAGAEALIDSLLSGLDPIRSALAENFDVASSERSSQESS